MQKEIQIRFMVMSHFNTFEPKEMMLFFSLFEVDNFRAV